MKNSIEEAIERLEYIDRSYSCNNYYSVWDLKCIEILLSDYKRVLKENEIYKKNSEIMSKENLSTAEQLKVEIKENFRLKNQLENNRKEYQETYKDIREELGELKKENEELNNRCRNLDKEAQAYLEELAGDNTLTRRTIKQLQEENEELNYKLHSKKIALKIYNRYTPKSKLKDIIDRIDYDIKKTKEIISKNTNIYASYRKNDYQIVRLKAMNTKSLDIKKRLQKLLESEE